MASACSGVCAEQKSEYTTSVVSGTVRARMYRPAYQAHRGWNDSLQRSELHHTQQP